MTNILLECGWIEDGDPTLSYPTVSPEIGEARLKLALVDLDDKAPFGPPHDGRKLLPYIKWLREFLRFNCVFSSDEDAGFTQQLLLRNLRKQYEDRADRLEAAYRQRPHRRRARGLQIQVGQVIH